jgi:hypothetical protein
MSILTQELLNQWFQVNVFNVLLDFVAKALFAFEDRLGEESARAELGDSYPDRLLRIRALSSEFEAAFPTQMASSLKAKYDQTKIRRISKMVSGVRMNTALSFPRRLASFRKISRRI